jgi:hypothetical protein
MPEEKREKTSKNNEIGHGVAQNLFDRPPASEVAATGGQTSSVRDL